jgi:hypothetical protein
MFNEQLQKIRDLASIYNTREKWGARPARGTTFHVPNKITIHHTATPNNDSISMPARMRQMQSFHMDTRGWSDIGYHWCIGQDGRVYEGRPLSAVGAHVGGNNTGNLGIAFIGDYHKTAPSDDMLNICIRLLRAIEKLTGVKPESIKGHRDYHSSDTCPGDELYKLLSKLRGES